MKNRNWLNVAEYFLLAGSGVGTLATILSQQLLFTAAPVSLLFLLNLVNRQRLDEAVQTTATASVAQLDRKVSGEFVSLQKQVQALPSFLDLASLRKSVNNSHQEAIGQTAQEIELLKRELEKPEWRGLNQNVRQMREQYVDLADSVSSITTQLNRLSDSTRVDGLEAAIDQLKTELAQLRVGLTSVSDEQKQHNFRGLQEQMHQINRRLNQLPQPFDASSLKQDIDSLIKAMGDAASRRELSRLVGQVEQLAQQNSSIEQSVAPIRLATTILKKQLDTIATQVQTQPDPSGAAASANAQVLQEIQATVAALEQGVGQLHLPSDLGPKSELAGTVASQLGALQQQLQGVQQMTQTLDRQQKDLRDWVSHLPQILDSTALQTQVKVLAARVEWAENMGQDVQQRVEAAVTAQLKSVMQQLEANRPVPQYELVFDVQGTRRSHSDSGCASRAILQQALTQAEGRLVIVYPYPTPETLNTDLIAQFRDFLDRQGCLDLGWGHLGNISNGYLPRSLDRRRAVNATEKGFLYDILNQLTDLKRQYPDQFRFKVLGTDENFLVCDRSFAVLGTQSLPTASVVFPQAAVGLRTTNPAVIQELVDRFDDPVLEADDVTAYFKRAITRYDLGDRVGSIADYTEVLQINPTDDVALNNRGLAHYDLGDRAAAIADLDRALQQNPNNFIAYCNRGVIRAELGDKLGAIEDYTCALQINPDYATAYFHRGLARTRTRNKIGAVQDYTECLRLNPEDGMAYFYRGLACIKLGQRPAAIEDLQKATQLFSAQGDLTNQQQALKTLEKLHTTVAIAGSSQPLVPHGV